jgi:AraC-like DNA-binding protein
LDLVVEQQLQELGVAEPLLLGLVQPQWQRLLHAAQLEPYSQLSLFVARRGLFRRRINGREQVVDALTAYLEKPGLEQQAAHPMAESHEGLFITPSARLFDLSEVAEAVDAFEQFRISPRLDLALRLFVAGLRRGVIDSFSADEVAMSLMRDLLEMRLWDGSSGTRPTTRAARRRLVDQARQAIVADPHASLGDLAERVAVSPHHLSRVFREVTGEKLSTWRNEIRLGLALERLEAGDENLALLATQLGFSDHGHLSRVSRRLFGEPPSALRRSLHWVS